MARDAIRQMKKRLRAGMDSQAPDRHREALDAALALLERSVRMRHRRLAVQRLNAAVTLGARVPAPHWVYCREAAAASRNSDVQALFVASAQAAHHAAPARQAGDTRHG